MQCVLNVKLETIQHKIHQNSSKQMVVFACCTLTSGRRDFMSLVNLGLEAESIVWEMYKVWINTVLDKTGNLGSRCYNDLSMVSF